MKNKTYSLTLKDINNGTEGTVTLERIDLDNLALLNKALELLAVAVGRGLHGDMGTLSGAKQNEQA